MGVGAWQNVCRGAAGFLLQRCGSWRTRRGCWESSGPSWAAGPARRASCTTSGRRAASCTGQASSSRHLLVGARRGGGGRGGHPAPCPVVEVVWFCAKLAPHARCLDLSGSTDLTYVTRACCLPPDRRGRPVTLVAYLPGTGVGTPTVSGAALWTLWAATAVNSYFREALTAVEEGGQPADYTARARQPAATAQVSRDSQQQQQQDPASASVQAGTMPASGGGGSGVSGVSATAAAVDGSDPSPPPQPSGTTERGSGPAATATATATAAHECLSGTEEAAPHSCSPDATTVQPMQGPGATQPTISSQLGSAPSPSPSPSSGLSCAEPPLDEASGSDGTPPAPPEAGCSRLECLPGPVLELVMGHLSCRAVAAAASSSRVLRQVRAASNRERPEGCVCAGCRGKGIRARTSGTPICDGRAGNTP